MTKKSLIETPTGGPSRKKRLELLNDIPEETFHAISKVAWEEARIANAILKRGQFEPGSKKQHWEFLGTRQKQKALMDFFAGVMTSEPFRDNLVKEMIARPMEVMKIYASTIQKDVEVNFNQQTAIVILPGKAGNVAQWMEMAKGVKDIDGEVVGEVGADAAQTWKNILEQK